MKHDNAWPSKPQNTIGRTNGWLDSLHQDVAGIEGAKDPFIENWLISTNPDFKDIAECIVLGEAELRVALSKINRALIALDKTNNNTNIIENLQLYQQRLNKALTALLHVGHTPNS